MLVSAIHVLITGGDEEVVVRVFYIYYPVQFQVSQEQIKALLNSGNEVNAMNPDYAWKLGLKIRRTNVGDQKINSSALETFEMVIADFQVEDKANRPRFFQKTFLVANTKFEVILEMPFLKISNANVLFSERILMWKFYITNEALPTTKRVQIVDPKKFIIAVLNVNSKTFVIYMAIWKQEKMPMHSKKQAQVRVLLFNKAFIKVPAEYSNYSNVFSAENIVKLPKNIKMNKHAIKLEDSKQLPFGSIYSLGLVELKTLKTYIKINLPTTLSGLLSPLLELLFYLTGS